MSNQLSFFPEINEKEVRKVVARQLKEYKAFKVSVQNKNEQIIEGMQDIFPILNKEQNKKAVIVRQIDRALENALDEVEREIITRKYLSNTRVKDTSIYMDMGLTKDQYYVHKREAIRLIATALGII
ncbi:MULTISPECIES: ArpU family phage packaging/lysis transcriptional regulator [Cytobacillus]|uniref:ArpU family phage packaging/lysis transcriptional regulator n=1 Tax=Cytobacillus TaxID=2675230 RepID=UPI0025A19583|nr:ArpU family phage packaging/lysis transcriptional regulator [Cytobacillus kochii]MDM5208430.1 ArpU family phage packaging/lysis transcriptional regulator [Cytobacillus kochii]